MAKTRRKKVVKRIVGRCFRVDGRVVHVFAKGRYGYMEAHPVGTGAGRRWSRATVVKRAKLKLRVPCPALWLR